MAEPVRLDVEKHVVETMNAILGGPVKDPHNACVALLACLHASHSTDAELMILVLESHGDVGERLDEVRSLLAPIRTRMRRRG